MTKLISFLKIIAEETRLRIILLLMERELCVCEICEIIEMSQPKVSRHLARMREAGIVKDDRQGQWVFYYPDFKDEVQKEIMQVIDRKKKDSLLFVQDHKKLTARVAGDGFCVRSNTQGAELK